MVKHTKGLKVKDMYQQPLSTLHYTVATYLYIYNYMTQTYVQLRLLTA